MLGVSGKEVGRCPAFEMAPSRPAGGLSFEHDARELRLVVHPERYGEPWAAGAVATASSFVAAL